MFIPDSTNKSGTNTEISNCCMNDTMIINPAEVVKLLKLPNPPCYSFDVDCRVRVIGIFSVQWIFGLVIGNWALKGTKFDDH